ncbi:MAG: hypothetical protein V5A87_05685 [Candidatus Bipolaricaulota bacterium]|nr:response regulator transcription factor [Candidatus Bipolaricaulota bacterium]
MNEKVVSIFGAPGEFRDKMKALVGAIPEVRKVVCFDGIIEGSEGNTVRDIAPDLVIIDSFKLDESCLSRLSQLRRSLPLTKMLVLVEDEKQGELLGQADPDELLVKGFRGDLFIRTVREMMRTGNGNDPEICEC